MGLDPFKIMQFKFIRIIGFCSFIIIFTYLTPASTQFNIQGPPGSVTFGKKVLALPNGNIVVTDPWYTITSPSTITQAGAVFLYDGKTGTLISRLTGAYRYARIGESVTALTNGNFVVTGAVWNDNYSALMGAVTLCSGITGCSGEMSISNSLVGNKPDDYVPSSITPLSNGNYLISSSSWDNGSIVDAGAVTFCNGTTGCVGVVSAANSLVGGNDNDQTGGLCDPCPRGIVELPNGNYLVSNIRWNGYRGAVTLGSSTTGITGTVSSLNSLVGNTANEMVGFGNANTIGITVLANNNYVVSTSNANERRGATTLCNGATGCNGTVTSANSLVGATPGDDSGSRVVPLTNGNYVVISSNWHLSSDIAAAGAVTFCNGTTGRIETISTANSLTGSNLNDRIGEFGVQALANGNYVVKSPSWNFDRGAVTFGNGTTGIIGTVSPQNSLVGTPRIGIPQDRVGERQFAVLTNGNYAVASGKWFNSRGAVTFINGSTGISGEISAANSLIGNTPEDYVGFYLINLTNGNYVVGSPGWDNGAIIDSGAATFCNGTTGCLGEITAANSLIGNSGDRISDAYQGVKALTNGNYVVTSPKWNSDRGAVTWGNGMTGTFGLTTAANSLVGENPNDNVGSNGVAILTNGNYVVNSSAWNNGSITTAGAVTYGNGSTGINGIVSVTNSLTGSKISDVVGGDGFNQSQGGGIYPLANGSYIVRSRYWDNGSIFNAGAVSLGKSNIPVTGIVSAENSVLGTISQVSNSGLIFVYDYRNKQLVVGRPDSNVVTFFRYDNVSTVFDFDGDSKTDISIFRPSVGEWWYLKSSTGGNAALQFGSSTDKLTPGDFTGDGKTDIAFFRPSTGEWFILRSEDNSFFSFQYGTSGDIAAPADYDGDGKTDAAVFRPSGAIWFILRSGDGGTTITSFGISDDKPVPADYDGDGKADIAIWRPSRGEWWYSRSSTGQTAALQFGTITDQPVPGDYTGDGKADVAFFRPATGFWFIQRSEDSSFFSFPFGAGGDIPAPGDYDGDGKFDSSVFRPSSSMWFVNRTTAGLLITNFGTTGDQPVPNAFVP